VNALSHHTRSSIVLVAIALVALAAFMPAMVGVVVEVVSLLAPATLVAAAADTPEFRPQPVALRCLTLLRAPPASR
jgi:hypothetical protein